MQIIPKSTKIVKEKVASRTHKSIEEVPRQDELIAPLFFAQRRDGQPIRFAQNRRHFWSLWCCEFKVVVAKF
jgi:hypothetical protein